MKILLAGDDFVRNTQLRGAIADAGVSAEFVEMSLPWPQVPFGPVAEVEEASGDEEAVADAIADCDVVVTQMAPVTAAVLDRAPRLRLVVCTRGGPVNVNLAAAAEHGVAVSATPGRNAVAAAEYALLMMLAGMRNLPAVHESVAAGEWRSDLYAYSACGSEMAGSTVGLIGLGEIGRRVAPLVQAMGATVLAHDPFVTPDQVPEVELTTLEDLLGRSDVVSLHARLTPQTAGMIGPEQFAMMRPGTVLVNTARGGLLDYPAAAAALTDGTLRSLALDVYEQEPVDPGSPLLSARNVVLSPHLAGATRQTAERAARMAGAEVARFASGRPLAYLKNGVPVAVPS
jgi:D-3-phosphoglycerate dehydrogenase